MAFAVVVTFNIKPDALAAFMPLMLENARTSLRSETGCHQFDVATDPERPNEVFLYEIYADPAAFDAHLASAHFRAFDAETAGMIDAKDVRIYKSVSQ